MKRALTRIALFGGALVVALALVEVVFRVADLRPGRLKQRAVYLLRHDGERFVEQWGIDRLRTKSNTPGLAALRGEYLADIRFRFVYDTHLGHRRPYFDERGSVIMATNADNLRGPAVPHPKPPGTWRLAAIGDSFTFGEGVPFEDTYPRQIERRLQDAGYLERIADAAPPGAPYARIDSINLGVSGFNAKEVLLYLQHKAPKYDPDFVVYGFFLNDVFSENPFTREMNRVYAEVYSPPAGLSAWSRCYDYFRYRAARRELGSLTREMYRRSFDRVQTDPAWAETREHVLAMRRLCAERGDGFLMLVFPVLSSMGADYPYRDIHELLRAFCAEHDIPCLDLLDAYEEHEAIDLQVHPTDHHPNEFANRMAAEQVVAYLTALADGGD